MRMSAISTLVAPEHMLLVRRRVPIGSLFSTRYHGEWLMERRCTAQAEEVPFDLSARRRRSGGAAPRLRSLRGAGRLAGAPAAAPRLAPPGGGGMGRRHLPADAAREPSASAGRPGGLCR